MHSRYLLRKETPGAILDISAKVAIDCPQKIPITNRYSMETSMAQVIQFENTNLVIVFQHISSIHFGDQLLDGQNTLIK